MFFEFLIYQTQRRINKGFSYLLIIFHLCLNSSPVTRVVFKKQILHCERGSTNQLKDKKKLYWIHFYRFATLIRGFWNPPINCNKKKSLNLECSCDSSYKLSENLFLKCSIVLNWFSVQLELWSAIKIVNKKNFK